MTIFGGEGMAARGGGGHIFLLYANINCPIFVLYFWEKCPIFLLYFVVGRVGTLVLCLLLMSKS